MNPAKPVVPDYDGAWIGAVLPALLDGQPAGWLPAPALTARTVLLLVLDGLGWDLLQTHRDRLPHLNAMAGGPIHAAVPSTTAACLTSITTGRTPAEHGVVGYRMRVGGQILNTLRWRVGKDKGPKPAHVQPVPPFLGREVAVVTRDEFSGTGFTVAHLRGGAFHGWPTPAALVTHCRQLLDTGARTIYAYYDGVDKIAHRFGLTAPFLADELSATDRLVGELLALLPADSALVVTSDHGQVHTPPERLHDLSPLAGMVTAYSGEPRFRSLHARPGAAADLLQAAGEHAGERAWVCTRDQVVASGWLGQDMSAQTAGRLGDVVLAARADHAFADPDQPKEAEMRSMHGSLTANEMLVPLLAVPGDA